jgi:hypothetical protein
MARLNFEILDTPYNSHILSDVQSRVGSQDTILSEIILPKGVTPWPIYPLKTRLRASPSLFIHKMPSESVTVRREIISEKYFIV